MNQDVLMNPDESQLEMLAIFHYVVAAVAGLFGLLPIVHLVIGVTALAGSFWPGADAAQTVFGCLFVGVPLFIMGCAWGLAVALIVAGRRLQQRTDHRFCLIVAAVNCLFMPVGTILGIFTIVVLMRPSVQALFGMGPVSE